MTATDYDPAAFGEVSGTPWDSATTFVVGGGPSLRGFDLSRLAASKQVIGVNQAMFDTPCQIGVSMDYNFIRENYSRLEDFAQSDHKLFLVLGPHWKGVLNHVQGAIYLNSAPAEGLSLYTDTIYHGCTSGYCALNVAVLKHSRRIILLGFDYGAIGGKHHYHDEYWWHRPTESTWDVWARRFGAAAVACEALGVEVINASPDSAITAFRTMELERAIAWGLS